MTSHWESRRIWIEGFVCVEMQNSRRDTDPGATSSPTTTYRSLTEVDTRALTIRLRSQGTPWGALVGGDGGRGLASPARAN